MKTPLVAVATIATALLLTGCGSPAPSPAGTWGPAAEGKPQLVLDPDGSLTGSDGCNRLMGSWRAKGDSITFREIASTQMACEGVDTWLSDLATATVDGSTLHVENAAGVEIGVLAR